MGFQYQIKSKTNRSSQALKVKDKSVDSHSHTWEVAKSKGQMQHARTDCLTVPVFCNITVVTDLCKTKIFCGKYRVQVQSNLCSVSADI